MWWFMPVTLAFGQAEGSPDMVNSRLAKLQSETHVKNKTKIKITAKICIVGS